MRFLRAIAMPEDGSCLLLFEAAARSGVEAALRLARIDQRRVSETPSMASTPRHGGTP
jgi:hypothetical protein